MKAETPDAGGKLPKVLAERQPIISETYQLALTIVGLQQQRASTDYRTDVLLINVPESNTTDRLSSVPPVLSKHQDKVC